MLQFVESIVGGDEDELYDNLKLELAFVRARLRARRKAFEEKINDLRSQRKKIQHYREAYKP